MDPLEDAMQKVSRYFTAEEVAILTPEELQLLALLETEDLPTIPEDEHAQAVAAYRARMHHALRHRQEGE